MRKQLFTLLLLSPWLFAPDVVAQGGSGKPITPPKPGVKPDSGTRGRGNNGRPIPKPVVSYSSLDIFGDIANAEISLYRNGKRVYSYQEHSNNATETVIGRLIPGTYKLVVRRKDFFDFNRSIKVLAKAASVSVSLQPKFGYLSIICTNVPDPTIDIEGVGRLTRSVDRLQIEPGKYRVSVGRSGYMTQSFMVEIKGGGMESRTILTLIKL